MAQPLKVSLKLQNCRTGVCSSNLVNDHVALFRLLVTLQIKFNGSTNASSFHSNISSMDHLTSSLVSVCVSYIHLINQLKTLK